MRDKHVSVESTAADGQLMGSTRAVLPVADTELHRQLLAGWPEEWALARVLVVRQLPSLDR